MPKKRGQATIFIVMAIVILLIGTFFFYSERVSLERTEILDIETVQPKNFVEACIVNVAKQGISILGLNGGYITFPESVEKDPRSYMKLGPLSNIKIPYWWYDGISNIPQESFIVKQIEDYVVSNLDSCIDDFSAFNNFDVKKLGNINAKVTLNENDVSIDVNYPLDLTDKLNKTTIKLENFRQKLPIRLKKVYEAARDIMEAENRDFFLEFKTIDLISMDEQIPTTDIEATCEEKVWIMQNLEKKLKKLLSANLPYINVVGSDFNENIFVPNPFGEETYKGSYFNNHYRWQISDKKYDKLKISFNYDEKSDMNFYARPSKNGLLKSNSQKGQELFNFLCLHIWHFTYDVVYPIRVTIIDDAAGLEPYQFNFAFEVSVDHNQANRKNFASTLLDQPDTADQQGYCNDVVNDITVYTQSNTTFEELAHVNLTFTCGIFDCDIGETEFISFGAAAGLTKPFPYCVNGILKGKKNGFENAQMFIQTETPGEYTLYFNPIKEFSNYEVVKHDYDNPSLQYNLDSNDIASITIKSTKNNFESFGVFPNSNGFPIKLLNDEREYDVTIYLSDGENIIGGYKARWAPSKAEIENARRIIFHAIEKKGNEDEQLLFISGLGGYSQQIPKPELIG